MATDQHGAAALPVSLTERINLIVNNLPATGITLGQLAQLVGQEGMMLLVALLSLVFIIPISIPGVSTIFGLAILTLSLGRLFGRDLWIPGKYKDRKISTEKLRPVLLKSLVWLSRLERISKPGRLDFLASAGLLSTVNSFALILGAVLLMAPFGMIPFSNTFPAVALLCLAVGILQRDGVCIIVGHVANLVTIAYFAALLAGGGLAVREMMKILGN